MKRNFYISAAFALFFGAVAHAQDPKKDNIGTETVDVRSAYQASVNDAFKIKDNPLMDDEDNSQKKPIKYTIFSFPVASTFKPEKGEAASVDQDSLAPSYNNYAMLSYGNYNTLNGEVGIVEQLDDNMYVGGLLSHISSQGGIKDVITDDNYSRSALDITLGSKNTNSNWNANVGVMQNTYNWYGLPEQVQNYTTVDLSQLDVKNHFRDVHIGGKYESYIGWFESVDAQYKYFWDAFDSKENRIFVTPRFNIELNQKTINVNLKLDYLNTTFGTHGLNNVANSYSYFNAIAEPSIRFYGDDYNIQLGVGAGVIAGKNNGISDNRAVVYPSVKAHYDVVKDIVLIYAGAEGGVRQNSYADLSAVNPFIAPDLELRPTVTLYDLYLGMRGKLYHNTSYNIRASYKAEDDRNMFVVNPFATSVQNREGFHYGNSYSVIYDKVSTITAFGELNFDFSKQVTIGLSGAYNHYNASDLERVYNMPEAKIGAKIHVDFTDQWFAGLNVQFIGQRWERNPQNVLNPTVNFQDYSLNSFTDLNMYVGYRPTERWTAFVRGNNLFNQDYMMWQNYRVQGLQVLGGVMYKFDF